MLQLGVGGPTVCRNAAHDTPNRDGGGGPCGHCDGEQLRLGLLLRLPRENSTPSPAEGIPVKQPRPRPLERELVPLHSLIKERVKLSFASEPNSFYWWGRHWAEGPLLGWVTVLLTYQRPEWGGDASQERRTANSRPFTSSRENQFPPALHLLT